MHDLMGDETEGMGVAALVVLIIFVAACVVAGLGLLEAVRYAEWALYWMANLRR
jgi:hypothetical protein